jgi:hypothetical protein
MSGAKKCIATIEASARRSGNQTCGAKRCIATIEASARRSGNQLCGTKKCTATSDFWFLSSDP